MTVTDTIAALTVLLSASCAAHGEWKGAGEIGLVFARGNNSAETANLKLDLVNEGRIWTHSFSAAALRARGQETTTGDRVLTADRYLASWQSDYRFTLRAFWFGGLRHESDRFSGFDYQSSISTGVGYKLIETERTKLSAQIGAGIRQLRNSLLAQIQRDSIFSGKVAFEHQLNDSTKIVNKLTSESGADNTQIANDLALQVKMTNKLALSVGIGLRHNTAPPAPLKKTDSLSTLNLVYSF